MKKTSLTDKEFILHTFDNIALKGYYSGNRLVAFEKLLFSFWEYCQERGILISKEVFAFIQQPALIKEHERIFAAIQVEYRQIISEIKALGHIPLLNTCFTNDIAFKLDFSYLSLDNNQKIAMYQIDNILERYSKAISKLSNPNGDKAKLYTEKLNIIVKIWHEADIELRFRAVDGIDVCFVKTMVRTLKKQNIW